MQNVLHTVSQWGNFSFSVAREFFSAGTACLPLRLAPARTQDPYRFYDKLRRRDPVHRSYLSGGYVLSRAEHIKLVLTDSRFSSDIRLSSLWQRSESAAASPGCHGRGVSNYTPRPLVLCDGPEHRSARSFTLKCINGVVEHLCAAELPALVDAQLCRATGAGACDWSEVFTRPLSEQICFRLLGIPEERQSWFRSLMVDGLTFAFHDGDRLVRYPFVFCRKPSRNPQLRFCIEGAFAEMSRQQAEGGVIAALDTCCQMGSLDPAEAAVLAAEVFVASFEALRFQVGNMICSLASHPTAQEQLRRDPGLIPAAVIELERYDPAVQAVFRYAKEDLVFAGRRIRRGDNLVLLLGSANRDPAAYPRPDEIDFHRPVARHFTFGNGRHSCLGIDLARRLEALLLRAFVERKLTVRLTGKPAWTQTLPMRGVSRLPLQASVE